MSESVLITGGHPGLAAALAARNWNTQLGTARSVPRRVDAVWWLPTGLDYLDRPAESALLDIDAGVFNIAAPCGYGDGFAARCAELGYHWRLFDIPPTVDGSVPPPCGVPRLLATLAGVIDEVTRRDPDYFRTHPLRLLLPPASPAPIVDPGPIAEALVELAAGSSSVGTRFKIDVGDPLPVRDMIACLSQAWEMPLELVATRDELTPVDRYTDALLATAARECQRPPQPARDIALPGVSHARQVSLMRSAGSAYREAFEVSRDRATAIPELLEQNEVNVGGVPLTYYACGADGPPIVILNALGQGLGYWYPLLEKLMLRHRLLLWQTRDTTASGAPATLADHVGDVTAVLRQEKIDRCHLLGWCTGAKVAIEFYLRQPAVVTSMLLLSGAFKQPGRPAGFDSAYEHSLETMCKALVRRPERAAQIRELFGSGTFAANDPADILASTNPQLIGEVNAPFATDESLVRYATQHLDFWSRQVLALGSEIRVPMLFAAGEYDQVVTSAGIRDAARHFPTGHFVEMPGATHHRMYDRPDLITELIGSFISRQDRRFIPLHLTTAAARTS